MILFGMLTARNYVELPKCKNKYLFENQSKTLFYHIINYRSSILDETSGCNNNNSNNNNNNNNNNIKFIYTG